MEKVTADFIHQADLKSLNSDKSLTNLIPGKSKTYLTAPEPPFSFFPAELVLVVLVLGENIVALE